MRIAHQRMWKSPRPALSAGNQEIGSACVVILLKSTVRGSFPDSPIINYYCCRADNSLLLVPASSSWPTLLREYGSKYEAPSDQCAGGLAALVWGWIRPTKMWRAQKRGKAEDVRRADQSCRSERIFTNTFLDAVDVLLNRYDNDIATLGMNPDDCPQVIFRRATICDNVGGL
jgi:hypothetical protein